jgi:hypothetical protein
MDIEDLEVAACPGIDLSARLLAELSVTQAHMDVASAWLAAADGRFRQRRTTRELNRPRASRTSTTRRSCRRRTAAPERGSLPGYGFFLAAPC